ncbi:hypothetical protein CY0110_16737 [Crocosphaera chwakensis CCY0110]|uniref:Uncharacterized protein n=1 Tax=Crocosphaera chwakensis CCY0110 TaxID=391612 RepID=A3II29_9CHRO|nr:hypothetical protein CY0110_16737 [Crocosphaera chwakensis CCY0110]
MSSTKGNLWIIDNKFEVSNPCYPIEKRIIPNSG